MSDKKRELWIDMAKGCGILLIIGGHLFKKITWFMNFAYSFHVPLFFLVSGYLFRKKPVKVFMKKSLTGFVIPYVALGAIVVYCDAYAKTFLKPNGKLFEVNCHHYLMRMVYQQRYSTLWFLACLLVVEIAFYLIMHISDRDSIQGIFVALIFIGGIVYLKSSSKALYYNVDAAMMMMPFFWVGHLLKKHDLMNKMQKHKIKSIAISGLIYGGSYYAIETYGFLTMDIYHNIYGHMALSYIRAFAGIILLSLLAAVIYSRTIGYIGRYSVIYFSLHQAVFINTLKHLPYFQTLLKGTTSEYLQGSFIILGILLVSLTLLNEILRRTPLKIVIGL